MEALPDTVWLSQNYKLYNPGTKDKTKFSVLL